VIGEMQREKEFVSVAVFDTMKNGMDDHAGKNRWHSRVIEIKSTDTVNTLVSKIVNEENFTQHDISKIIVNGVEIYTDKDKTKSEQALGDLEKISPSMKDLTSGGQVHVIPSATVLNNNARFYQELQPVQETISIGLMDNSAKCYEFDCPIDFTVQQMLDQFKHEHGEIEGVDIFAAMPTGKEIKDKGKTLRALCAEEVLKPHQKNQWHDDTSGYFAVAIQHKKELKSAMDVNHSNDQQEAIEHSKTKISTTKGKDKVDAWNNSRLFRTRYSDVHNHKPFMAIFEAFVGKAGQQIAKYEKWGRGASWLSMLTKEDNKAKYAQKAINCQSALEAIFSKTHDINSRKELTVVLQNLYTELNKGIDSGRGAQILKDAFIDAGQKQNENQFTMSH
jgi:hypothetical protein